MKKENTKKSTQETIKRDRINKKFDFASKNEINKVLTSLNTSKKGLKEDQIEDIRDKYGYNKITHEKKKSLFKRIWAAFINPFTVILLFLVIVSIITDIIIPIRENNPEDVDYLTAIIIMTMVIISGVLRFVQETRSGNAAERLLEMITTTVSVERIETRKKEIPIEDIVVGDIIHLAARRYDSS